MTQLRADQLDRHLVAELAPVYFIHGDETLLVDECADAVRAAMRKQGYSDRQVFTVEPGFDWQSLSAAGNSLSLFSERRVFELRLPTGKPGKEGAKVLSEYAARPPEDTLLLIISARQSLNPPHAKASGCRRWTRRASALRYGRLMPHSCPPG